MWYFLSCAVRVLCILVFNYALKHLGMLIFRKPHFCVGLSLPFLPLSACVRACVCRLPTALTLLRRSEAHRDAAPTRSSSGSASVPSVLRASTRLPRVVFAVQAPLHSISSTPPLFGSSHAAVVALDTGQFVIDQAASPWTWRLLGTRTLSPRRYPPPKLNSRFPVGE